MVIVRILFMFHVLSVKEITLHVNLFLECVLCRGIMQALLTTTFPSPYFPYKIILDISFIQTVLYRKKKQKKRKKAVKVNKVLNH